MDIKIMINIDELTKIQKVDLIKDKLFNTFIIYYPKLHKEVFERLAMDEYWYIRNRLATNPNLPTSVMEILAKDEFNSVKYWLAKNPTYQKYSKDKKNGKVL